MKTLFTPRMALPSLLCLVLGACGGMPTNQAGTAPDTSAVKTRPVLTETAQVNLAQAEAAAKAARASFTLWTPAEAALKQAREAANQGDSLTVMQAAARVLELCRLSARQAGFPTTEIK